MIRMARAANLRQESLNAQARWKSAAQKYFARRSWTILAVGRKRECGIAKKPQVETIK